MTGLQHLIAEATALAGGNTCASGHDWESAGGRQCPHDHGDIASCSQTVYECRRCGEVDYGQRGGPGHADCGDGPERLCERGCAVR